MFFFGSVLSHLLANVSSISIARDKVSAYAVIAQSVDENFANFLSTGFFMDFVRLA